MELKSLVEAILFAAQRPLSAKEIKTILAKPAECDDSEAARAFKRTSEAQISAALQELKLDYTQQGRSFQIQEVTGGCQLISQPQFAPWLKQLFEERRLQRLSQPALETLALIAYRQPISRAQIESVRGVTVDGVMQTLLERGLITMTGRADVPGRPMLYGTTRVFLEHFGLGNLDELPAVEELRKRDLRGAGGTGTTTAPAPPSPGRTTTDAESIPAPQAD